MSPATATKAKKKLSQAARKRKAKELIVCREAGKEAYGRADTLLQELLESGMQPGDAIDLPGGVRVAIVDNFINRLGQVVNKAWKPAGVNRFDVKVSQQPKK